MLSEHMGDELMKFDSYVTLLAASVLKIHSP